MKTKINRIVALLSIAILCFGFTACSSSGGEETTTATEAAVTEVSAESVEITNGASSTEAVMASTTTPGASTSAPVNNGTTARTNTTTTTTKRNTTTTRRITTTKRTTTKKTTTTKTTTAKQYCYLTIECSRILDNMDSLKDGHSKYVPSDGNIIKNYKFTITGKETVYDVLKEACKDNGIKLTAEKSNTGIYVKGINNLDEFDCGKYSGWIYRVNGITPAKSSSTYTIHNGDRITWSYKC